jgi:hypothetical protein
MCVSRDAQLRKVSSIHLGPTHHHHHQHTDAKPRRVGLRYIWPPSTNSSSNPSDWSVNNSFQASQTFCMQRQHYLAGWGLEFVGGGAQLQ